MELHSKSTDILINFFKFGSQSEDLLSYGFFFNPHRPAPVFRKTPSGLILKGYLLRKYRKTPQ